MGKQQATSKRQSRETTRGAKENPLEPKIREIRHELAKWNKSDVLGRHRIGQIVKQVRAKQKHYGSHAVERIGNALGFGTSWVYECAWVAETWSESELRELLQLRDAVHGQPLTWSHLAIIARLTDRGDRKRYIESALAEGWTVAQLKAQIHETPESEEAQQSGPAPRIRPWVRDIKQTCDTALSKQQQWVGTVVNELENGVELDEAARTELEQALNSAQQARDGYEQLIQKLSEATGRSSG